MKKKSCRSDFLSDNSSDNEDDDVSTLSLRERLARKRRIETHSSLLTEQDNNISVPTLSKVKHGDTGSNNDCEVLHTETAPSFPKHARPGKQTFKSCTLVEIESDTTSASNSEDEIEKFSLSRIIGSQANMSHVRNTDRHTCHNDNVNIPACGTRHIDINDKKYGNTYRHKNIDMPPRVDKQSTASKTIDHHSDHQSDSHGNNTLPRFEQEADDVGYSRSLEDSQGTTTSLPECNVKKKRTKAMIEENKRKAQEKKEERERVKLAKEAEKLLRMADRQSKKQLSVGSCLQYIKVLVDTHVVNSCGLGVALFKTCEELGVSCETKELAMPFTIMWKRRMSESTVNAQMKVETIHSEIDEAEVLAIVPVIDFVQMVNTFKQKQGGMSEAGITLRDYLNRMKSALPDRNISVIVPGIEQYFREKKSQNQRKFKDAVLSSNNSNHVSKASKCKTSPLNVSRVDIEEAVTDTQLHTDCCTYMLETPDDVADFVRRFSKAVAERPAKKDRFEPIFSFHEEGVGGVKVDKNGVGLLKVWKQQLLQFKNISPDVGQAIIAEYPSPLCLRQAYSRCTSEREAIRLLENIVVRRGAGVLETARRVGKELSRRIYTYFTCEDPALVIK